MPESAALTEQPRPLAREVLRRLVEPVMGSGETSWNLLSHLTAHQTYSLLAVTRLRDHFTQRAAGRGGDANELFHEALRKFMDEGETFTAQQDAISRVRRLFEQYSLPVTKFAAIYENVANGSPVEWALAYAE